MLKNKVWIPIIIMVFATLFTSIGQFFWKKGSESVFGISSFILNPYVILGFLVYGFASLLLIISLKKTDLSIAYPVLATGYIWAVVLGVVFLNERIHQTKILGISCIMIGIFFLGRGGKK